jgi:sulfate transport system ATP-binding protein
MRFLGPVTEIDGRLVRPHDLEVSDIPLPNGATATVTRIVRLGFEVRVEMSLDGRHTWAQITRGAADRLDLAPGDTIHVRPTADARLIAAGAT